jgi:hypothetical protein
MCKLKKFRVTICDKMLRIHKTTHAYGTTQSLHFHCSKCSDWGHLAAHTWQYGAVAVRVMVLIWRDIALVCCNVRLVLDERIPTLWDWKHIICRNCYLQVFCTLPKNQTHPMALNLWNIQCIKNFVCIRFIIVITQRRINISISFRGLTCFTNVSYVISSWTSEQSPFQLWCVRIVTIFLCNKFHNLLLFVRVIRGRLH